MDDRKLLREYVEQAPEAAFAELVNRYADLVYSAALAPDRRRSAPGRRDRAGGLPHTGAEGAAVVNNSRPQALACRNRGQGSGSGKQSRVDAVQQVAALCQYDRPYRSSAGVGSGRKAANQADAGQDP